MAIEINLSTLRQQVQEGWKKTKLAEHYELPVAQMTQVLKQAGLKIRKFHAPKYQLVDDTVHNTEEIGEDINVVSNEITEETVEVREEATTEANW